MLCPKKWSLLLYQLSIYVLFCMTCGSGVFVGKVLSYTSRLHCILPDDVIKWKHFPRYWPFVRGIHRWPMNSPHKGQWRGALMFSLICVWINDWVNNCEAGDLRYYRAHYDVIVMENMNAWYCCWTIFVVILCRSSLKIQINLIRKLHIYSTRKVHVSFFLSIVAPRWSTRFIAILSLIISRCCLTNGLFWGMEWDNVNFLYLLLIHLLCTSDSVSQISRRYELALSLGFCHTAPVPYRGKNGLLHCR